MPLSKKQEQNSSENLSEYYEEEHKELLDKIIKLRFNDKKLTKPLYNKIEKLDDYQLNSVLVELGMENLIEFVKMYKEDHHISMPRYASIFRHYWFNQFSHRTLMLLSKFHKKYGYSIKLFYILNQKVGISYRDLEDLSGIGKDTINRYVNYYKKWLKLDNEIGELKRELSELKHKRFKISQKF